MKSFLNSLEGSGIGLASGLALFTLNHWPAYQRVSTFLAAQEAGPPTQTTADSLGGLLNEETAPQTTADKNAPPRSILAQIIDFMSDDEFVVFLGLTGYTAEQLDKEESEFVKTVQSNPKLFEAHLHEAVAKKTETTLLSLRDTFGEN